MFWILLRPKNVETMSIFKSGLQLPIKWSPNGHHFIKKLVSNWFQAFGILVGGPYYTVVIISVGVWLEGNLLSNQTPKEIIETVYTYSIVYIVYIYFVLCMYVYRSEQSG